MSSQELVLVTNAASHIASHIIKQLLQNNYLVRAVLSSKDTAESSASLLELCSSDRRERLQLVQVDVLDLAACRILVNDCTYVVHVASPRPLDGPQHHDDLWIGMTRSTTLNILQACQTANNPTVEKVVITSSCLAVHDLFSNNNKHNSTTSPYEGGHHNQHNHQNGPDNVVEVYDEGSWTDIVGLKSPLITCKVSAERAAWDYIHSLHKTARFALTTILPTLVLGPVLHKGEQIGVGKQLTEYLVGHRNARGTFLPVPNLMLPVCDVRDVALAHVRALTARDTDGMRILVATHTVGLQDLAAALYRELDPLNYSIKPSPKTAPNSKVASSELMTKLSCMLLTGDLKRFAPLLHRTVVYDNTRMRQLLGFEPILADKSIADMADSLIQRGDIRVTKSHQDIMNRTPEANYFQSHHLQQQKNNSLNTRTEATAIEDSSVLGDHTKVSRTLRKRFLSGEQSNGGIGSTLPWNRKKNDSGSRVKKVQDYDNDGYIDRYEETPEPPSQQQQSMTLPTPMTTMTMPLQNNVTTMVDSEVTTTRTVTRNVQSPQQQQYNSAMPA